MYGKEKIKLGVKILIVVLILLITLGIIFVTRFNAINKINNKYAESNNKTNCYYLSESDGTIMEYYRKDGIMKLNVKEVNGTGDITFWKNNNTDEALVF